jgi:hypothetical protein
MRADDIAARLQAKRVLHDRLNAKHCELRPDCGCCETLEKWGNDLSDDKRIWDVEVLDWAETSIFITLACVERYCPDPIVKGWARQQLKDRFWQRQKAMGIYVEQ